MTYLVKLAALLNISDEKFIMETLLKSDLNSSDMEEVIIALKDDPMLLAENSEIVHVIDNYYIDKTAENLDAIIKTGFEGVIAKASKETLKIILKQWQNARIIKDSLSNANSENLENKTTNFLVKFFDFISPFSNN